MDITWLGHACTRLRTRSATILNDPTDRSDGVGMGRPTADIVTVSHDHPQHAYVEGVKGEFMLIDGPGEYEVSGTQILGVSTSLRPGAHASEKNGEDGGEDGETRAPGRNVAYLITAEDLHVAHLGATGVPPTSAQAEALSNADILIVPVGDPTMLTPAEAARAVRDLEPSIVIPVCYVGGPDEGSALKAFLTAVGIEPEGPEPRLTVQRRALGERPRVVLLDARGRD